MQRRAGWALGFLVAAVFATVASSRPDVARAASWCASPLLVHEWGVHEFSAGGTRAAPVTFPPYFHQTPTPASPSAAAPVRNEPADHGIRFLPIVHFYGDASSASIPVGLEVGFRFGRIASWFPRADHHDLVPRRLRQLEWNRLELSQAPQHVPTASAEPWIASVRNVPALWVNGATESDRFVFYDGPTSERVALRVRRGSEYTSQHRHYVLENTSASPVHDVLVIHREGRSSFVFHAPQIPARASAGFLLEDHRAEGEDFEQATTSRLRSAWAGAAPFESDHRAASCVMMRNPAVPVVAVDDHRLYSAELDSVLSVWRDRFFEQQGTTILYREDTTYLARSMPLKIYTDMYHAPSINRLGIALWSGVTLP